MKSRAEKVIFWILYTLPTVPHLIFVLYHVSNDRDGFIFDEEYFIVTLVWIVSWYFILKILFWVMPKLGHLLSSLLRSFWNFILNRGREFGKALRDD